MDKPIQPTEMTKCTTYSIKKNINYEEKKRKNKSLQIGWERVGET